MSTGHTINEANTGQRPYSIRTRIKTNMRNAEDGLKNVRDHIPLEQGLRLMQPIVANFGDGQRPYSIRTRIKTHYCTILH